MILPTAMLSTTRSSLKMALWFVVMLGFALGIALAMPITQTGAATAITVAIGATVGVAVAMSVDTARKRSKSSKCDARSRSGKRSFRPGYPSLRVRVLLNGRLERMHPVAAAAATDDDEEERTESCGLNTLNISAAHHFAYFNPDQAATFTEAQQAAMNATAEVMQATTVATQESNLGKNSGVSYWKKIANWMRFENWVIM